MRRRRRPDQRPERSSSSASLAVIGPVTGSASGSGCSGRLEGVMRPLAISSSILPGRYGDSTATGSPSCVTSIVSPARTRRIVEVSLSRSSRIPIRVAMWPHVTTKLSATDHPHMSDELEVHGPRHDTGVQVVEALTWIPAGAVDELRVVGARRRAGGDDQVLTWPSDLARANDPSLPLGAAISAWGDADDWKARSASGLGSNPYVGRNSCPSSDEAAWNPRRARDRVAESARSVPAFAHDLRRRLHERNRMTRRNVRASARAAEQAGHHDRERRPDNRRHGSPTSTDRERSAPTSCRAAPARARSPRTGP